MVFKLVKWGIGAALVAGVFYAINTAKKANFGYSIKGYGTPGFNGFNNIVLPVIVEFNNPTPVPANIDNVTANIYINMAGRWAKAAVINQPLSVPTGVSQTKINAKIDLSSFFGGGLLNLLQTANGTLSKRSLEVRTDVKITYGPLTFPEQSFTQNVPLG